MLDSKAHALDHHMLLLSRSNVFKLHSVEMFHGCVGGGEGEKVGGSLTPHHHYPHFFDHSSSTFICLHIHILHKISMQKVFTTKKKCKRFEKLR